VVTLVNECIWGMVEGTNGDGDYQEIDYLQSIKLENAFLLTQHVLK